MLTTRYCGSAEKVQSVDRWVGEVKMEKIQIKLNMVDGVHSLMTYKAAKSGDPGFLWNRQTPILQCRCW